MIYLYVSLIAIFATAFTMYIFKGGGAGGAMIKAAIILISGIVIATCLAGALSTLVFGSPLVGAVVFIVLFAAGLLWFLRR